MGGGKDVVVEIEENIRLEGWWRWACLVGAAKL
jgi:hypothetical protein